MSSRDFDVVVIGAGIVGLACGAALAESGRRVLLLEKGPGIAQGITSRNSEVVHAGIYYEPGSLKARLCVEGNRALYRRCETLRIAHRRTEKLIVACDQEEIAALEQLRDRAHRNGASQVECIDAKATRALEPAVHAVAALHSPSTGIVDAHALAVSYWAECEAHEAVLLVQAEVVEVARNAAGWRVVARQPDATTTPVACGAVVNAAGLEADRLAEMAGVDVEAWGYRLHYCKGDYFGLAPGRRVALSRLVYPLPGPSGLGIHATLDLSGRVRFGPDAEYVQAPRYDVDPDKAQDFSRAIGAYLPGVDAGWLVPDYAGVRPRLAGPGEGFRDFVVREESDRGAPAWVDCVGIESPGLTAAPAIAVRVREELRGL